MYRLLARSCDLRTRGVCLLGGSIVALHLAMPVLGAGNLGDVFAGLPRDNGLQRTPDMPQRCETLSIEPGLTKLASQENLMGGGGVVERGGDATGPVIGRRIENPCGAPGISTEMVSASSAEGRPWLGIQPQLAGAFENQPPPSDAAAFSKFGSYADAEPVGRGCARFDIGTEFVWAAPVFYHQPLYFEQVALERYGHSHCNWHVESVISAAHFFAAIPILPYKIGAEPVCSRISTYGRGRPGNCYPAFRENLPWSWRGFILQGIATPGFIALFP